MPPPECSSPSIPGKNRLRKRPLPSSVPEPQVETPKQELITQDIEESVALEDAKKKKEEEKRKKQEAEKKRKEEEEKERIRREEAEKNRLAEERRKKDKPLATRWPELLVWETPRVTAKATLKAEPVTKEVRSVTLIMGRMKA